MISTAIPVQCGSLVPVSVEVVPYSRDTILTTISVPTAVCMSEHACASLRSVNSDLSEQ